MHSIQIKIWIMVIMQLSIDTMGGDQEFIVYSKAIDGNVNGLEYVFCENFNCTENVNVSVVG